MSHTTERWWMELVQADDGTHKTAYRLWETARAWYLAWLLRSVHYPDGTREKTDALDTAGAWELQMNRLWCENIVRAKAEHDKTQSRSIEVSEK